MRRLSFIALVVLLGGLGGSLSAQQNQWIQLPAPVHAPISWQNATNKALARPQPPGGLHITAPASSPELNAFLGTWQQEKRAGGEPASFVLGSEGLLTVHFAEPQTNLTANGKWELKEQAIYFKFPPPKQASIPALRETKLFVVREGSGIVLVGEQHTRFTRPLEGH